MKTLVLYASSATTLSYYDDWYDAFKDSEDFKTDFLNLHQKQIAKSIHQYDYIILLHSTNGDQIFLKKLKELVPILDKRKGVLAIFAGNEVNLESTYVQDRIAIFASIQPDFIFSQLLQETAQWLYNSCHLSKVYSIPHALNSKVFFASQSYEKRFYDIGTRSHKYSVFLGDQKRNNLFATFDRQARNYALRCDISVDAQDRFNRQDWAKFLNQCKATLATEAGSFYLQKDDAMVIAIKEFLIKELDRNQKIVIQNTSCLYKIYALLPHKVQQILKQIYVGQSKIHFLESTNAFYEEIYEQIHREVISQYSPCPFYSKAISSRHFDAIGTQTLLISTQGRYNDILLPHQNYMVVNDDYSNMQEVCDYLRDSSYVHKITTETLEYVLDCHQHKHRIKKIKKILEGVY